MKRLVAAGLALGLAALLSPAARAEAYKRWHVDFKTDGLKTFTLQDARGKRTPCMYAVFTIKNPTDRDVPLLLHAALQNGRGKWFWNNATFEADHQIIWKEERLGAVPLKQRAERVRELKAAGKYLTSMELLAKGKLGAGEEVTGLAIFPKVDYWASHDLTMHVTGLVDVVKVRDFDPNDPATLAAGKYEYENRVLTLRYELYHDPVEVPRQLVDYRGKEWVIRPFGPATDVETLGRLINALGDPAQAPLGKMLDELIRTLTLVKDAGFDPSKSPEDNADAIRKYREWYVRNRSRLEWDQKEGAFRPTKQMPPPGSPYGPPASPAAAPGAEPAAPPPEGTPEAPPEEAAPPAEGEPAAPEGGGM